LPTKRDDATEIAPPLSLIGLHVADALPNALHDSATAERIVKTSLEMPLPVTSSPNHVKEDDATLF
jgi:hypothetical protein